MFNSKIHQVTCIILPIAWLIVLMTRCGNGFDEYKDQKFYRTYSSLTDLPGDIPREVREIHLDHNRISGLEAYSFLNATACVKLDLSHNAISIIDNKAFDGLSSLTYLSLSYNKITGLNSDVFLPLSLCTYLGIENNPLTTIEQGAFNGLGILHTLSLYKTKLTYLNAHMFQGLANLEILDLGHGGTIQSIADGTFAELNAVTELGLQGHNLTAITTGTFKGLYALSNLRLQENRVSSIDDRSFWDSSNLRSLWLEDNQLSELRYELFEGLYALHQIWLSGNPLHTVRSTVFTDQPRPLQLALGGGIPLQCDRRLCWLKQQEENGLVTYRLPANKPNCKWSLLDCSPKGKSISLSVYTNEQTKIREA